MMTMKKKKKVAVKKKRKSKMTKKTRTMATGKDLLLGNELPRLPLRLSTERGKSSPTRIRNRKSVKPNRNQ
jgi:hypothetical protein